MTDILKIAARALTGLVLAIAAYGCQRATTATAAAPAAPITTPQLCVIDLLERHRRTDTGQTDVRLCTDELHAHLCGVHFCSLLGGAPCADEGERLGWVFDFAAYDGVSAALTSYPSSSLHVRNGAVPWNVGLEDVRELGNLVQTDEGLAVVEYSVRGALVARRVTDPSVQISMPLPLVKDGSIHSWYRFERRTLLNVSVAKRSVVVAVESLTSPPRIVLECEGPALIRADKGTADCVTQSEAFGGLQARDQLGPWTVELRDKRLFSIDASGRETPIMLPLAAFTFPGIGSTWTADALERGGGRLFVLASAGWLAVPELRTDAAVFELTIGNGSCPPSKPPCLACDPLHRGDRSPIPKGAEEVEDLPAEDAN